MGRRFLYHIWPLIFASLGGCSQQDADGLERIGRKLAARAELWTASLNEQLPLKLASLQGDTLENRVANRLRWDRLLVEEKIEVAANGAEIELKGLVSSAEQKRRAVELAENTTGVERVVDHLQVKE